MKAYHVTSTEAAAAIESDGFGDLTGTYQSDHEWTGVRISNRALDCSEGVYGEADFEMTVEPQAIADFEWTEEDRGYREWLVPAIWRNAQPRRISERTRHKCASPVGRRVTRLRAWIRPTPTSILMKCSSTPWKPSYWPSRADRG